MVEPAPSQPIRKEALTVFIEPSGSLISTLTRLLSCLSVRTSCSKRKLKPVLPPNRSRFFRTVLYYSYCNTNGYANSSLSSARSNSTIVSRVSRSQILYLGASKPSLKISPSPSSKSLSMVVGDWMLLADQLTAEFLSLALLLGCLVSKARRLRQQLSDHLRL